MYLSNLYGLKINFLVCKKHKKINKIYLLYIYMFTLYRFFSKVYTIYIYNNNSKRDFYKNIFFKKNFKPKTLISKRAVFFFKKKKFFKKKRKNTGNFFFKKFFFKTLLRCRKHLGTFLLKKKRIRQGKLTTTISQSKYKYNSTTTMYEYTIDNVLLRSHLFFFKGDIQKAIISNLVFVNSTKINNIKFTVTTGDCIQVRIDNVFYTYYKKSRNFFRKKMKIIRYNSWKFFKKKFFRKKHGLKQLKRKNPKFLFLFFIFKLNIPSFLEVDFSTLTLFVLKRGNYPHNKTYILKKSFTFNLFSLYNYKNLN